MALVGAAPTLISSIQDEKITRGNGNGIAWNVRGRLQDAASIETGKPQGEDEIISENQNLKKKESLERDL